MKKTSKWTVWATCALVVIGPACATGGDDGVTTDDGVPSFRVSGGTVPTYEPDPLHFSLLPDLWTNGPVGGVAVDSHDHVWVHHRPGTIQASAVGAANDPPTADCCVPAPPVLEFDPDGRFVRAWGGPSDEYEWFASEHGIYVDSRDNVWLTGSAAQDNHILKFTSSGRFLLQIGRAGMNQGSNDTANLGGPADLFLHEPTSELFVADGYVNRRVIVFDADTGAYKRHWGAYGNRPDDTAERPSRAEYVAQLARGDSPPQQFHTPVHTVHVARDGMVYVGDRSHLRIQVFDLDGTFVREVFIRSGTLDGVGTVHELATSPDPEETFLYVVDGANSWIHILERETMRVVSRVGGRKGHNAREFFHLHSFATDSNGNLIIGEVNNGQRFYRWRFTGMGAPSNTELPP
jgi:hypothetical protein